jgi:hypothetical protein
MIGVDGVDSLMKNLKLSEIEKKGLKLQWSSGDQIGLIAPKAMGKIVVRKACHCRWYNQHTGEDLVSLRGIACKTVGENVFLFTFRQASGKRKAIEDGLWMFDNELLIMEDYDEN